MIGKPDLHDEKIIVCLQREYGLKAVQVDFLPIGADQNAAAYRIVARDGTPYFLKLRRGVFDEVAVALPRYLSDRGLRLIIPPLITNTGQLWTELDGFRLVLYPFVEGRSGYEVNLSPRQWNDLGQGLKRIHALDVPPALTRRIRVETYDSRWRRMLVTSLQRAEDSAFDDPVSVVWAAFLAARREVILDLVGRANHLAEILQAESRELVLCHSDIHAGNILIDTSGTLFIVDWDEPSLAPKERDLMFIGGGLMGTWCTAQEEEALFYRGYGQTQIDPVALAYFRYERIIQDLAVFSEQVVSKNLGSKDREQSLRFLESNFLPGGTIDIAYRSDSTQEGARLRWNEVAPVFDHQQSH